MSDLPLHAPITTGTFTISGKTYNISSTDITLQELMDQINTTVGGVDGVNPEGDSTGVTISYDGITDKMVWWEYLMKILQIFLYWPATDTSNFTIIKIFGQPEIGGLKANILLVPLI